MSAHDGQWRLQSLQLVNWGGFEGHHRVDLSADSTLISGATGTGKSTLLDAYIALLMPSRVPFNGASNDNVSGRARGGDQRNVLRYMRGKIDDNRPEGSVTLTDQVLRGRGAPTWSGIAATWHTNSGREFSAMRLYYALPSAARFDDITKRMATIDGAFDLTEVADLSAALFDPAALRQRFAGLEVHGSYRTFATQICTRLGIGLPGEGDRALGLLARIQAGRAVTTVDGLFKSMVLEQPKTLAIADDAVAHFDDLNAAYEAMKTAEQQVDTLSPIAELYAEYSSARQEADTVAALGLDSNDPRTPLHAWAVRTETQLIDDRLSAITAATAVAQRQADTARRTEDTAEAELAALRAARPPELDDADRDLEQLSAAHRDSEQALKLYRDRTAILGDPPANSEEFAAAHDAAAQALRDYPEHAAGLRARRDIAVGRHHQLQQHRSALADELTSLSGRSGVIPAELHQARCAIAAALNTAPDQVPFVGELLDMATGFEDWRVATDRALGGLAVTILIDVDDLDRARAQINDLRLARRVSFEGAVRNQPVPRPRGTDVLSGRLRVDESSPYAGWLMTRIVDRFDYQCVDDIGELAATQRGLTITGQTKTGRRGAHGGARPPVIGLSNTDQQTQLAGELATTDRDIAAAAAQIADLDAAVDDLNAARDAHRYVLDTAWAGIDVAASAARLDAAGAHRDAIAAGSATPNNLHLHEVLEQRESASRARHLAQAELTQLSVEAEELAARRTVLGQLAAAGALSGEITELLDTEVAALDPDLTPNGFAGALARLRQRLAVKASAADVVAERAEKMLTRIFAAFQRQWPHPDLGTGVESFPGYRDILDDLTAEGLHRRRAAFVRDVNDWTGVDLLRLHGAFDDAVDEITARLGPINTILAALPFGPGADRLHITLRRAETADITAFRKDLKALAATTTQPCDSDAAAEKHFLTVARFISRIRKASNTSDREHFLDVRRHVYIEAERRDIAGATLNVYASLAGKSGGESQELIAFIVGAALRYQLGEADWPRYAPIILDEGFIKSDAAFAGRAVAAWKGLGFQLIIGAPDDKVNSIEPHVDRILCITKNQHHHSHVTDLTAPQPRPSPAGRR